jgi:hypothetical protein
MEDSLNLAAGVLLLALAGEAVRRVRLRGLPPVYASAPVAVTARARLSRTPGKPSAAG